MTKTTGLIHSNSGPALRPWVFVTSLLYISSCASLPRSSSPENSDQLSEKFLTEADSDAALEEDMPEQTTVTSEAPPQDDYLIEQISELRNQIKEKNKKISTLQKQIEKSRSENAALQAQLANTHRQNDMSEHQQTETQRRLNYEEGLKQAHALFRSKDYGKAVLAYSALDRQFTRDFTKGVPLYGLGRSWFELKEYGMAQRLLKKFVAEYMKSDHYPDAAQRLADTETMLASGSEGKKVRM